MSSAPAQAKPQQGTAMGDSRRFQLSLFLLKLLGGFPYQRKKKNQGVEPVTKVYTQMHAQMPQRRASTEDAPHYQVRVVWQVWACCLVLVLLCYTGVVVIEIPHVKNRYDAWPKTLMVANKVRELITSVTVLVMEVYLLSSSSLALETSNQYLNLLPASGRHSARLSTDAWVAVSGVVFLAGNCLVLTSYIYYLTQNGINWYIYFVFTQYIETILYLLINSFVISYFYTVILLFCGVFERIKTQLLEACSKSIDGVDVNLQKPFVKMCGREVSVQPPNTETDSSKHMRTKVKANKASGDLTKITKDCQRTLTQLHLLQHSLNSFLGLPITLIMLTSVVYSLLACFYLSYMNEVTNTMRLMSVSYFMIGILPELLLSNLPVLLQTKEEELRLLIRSLLRQEDDAKSKNELREVLDVVDESPGFELCRVFTLGRARMLDIFSFMATYLIILLQFRFTEGCVVEANNTANNFSIVFQA